MKAVNLILFYVYLFFKLGFCKEVWPRDFYSAVASTGHILDALDEHTATLILLPGFKETAEDWLPNAEEMNDKLPWIKIIIPTPSERPIMSTMQPGILPKSEHAWYDLVERFGYFGLPTDQHDATGIRMARAWLRDLIQEEVKKTGIASNRIVLAGFDMGGVVALVTILTNEEALGGAVGVGAYIPLQPRISNERTAANRQTPILILHGDDDQLVPFTHAHPDTLNFLKKLGQPVENHVYDGIQHEWTQDMQNDFVKYVEKAVPNFRKTTNPQANKPDL